MNEVMGLDLAGGVTEGPKPAVMRSGQQIFTAGVQVVAPGPTPIAEVVAGVLGSIARPEPVTEVLTRSPSVVDAVRAALTDTRFDFRQPETIAQEVGMPIGEVQTILRREDVARRPWGRPTATIFTSADKPVTLRERISLIDVFLAKRPD